LDDVDISEDDRVRVLSASGLGAGEWLGVAPFCPLTTLQDFDWRVCALWRLGLPIPCFMRQQLSACGPKCSSPVDSYGHHFMRCFLSSKWPRHQAFLGALAACARRARVTAHRSTIDRIDEGLRALLGQRQADLILPDFRGIGIDAHLDVSVVHPLCRMYSVSEYLRPGDAVRHVRAVAKYEYYSDLTSDKTLFVVFGAESYGAIDPDAVRFLNDHIVHPFVVLRGLDPHSRQGRTFASVFRR